MKKSCKFAVWLYSNCTLTGSGWMYNYDNMGYFTIEEMYKFWLKNINK